MYTSSVDALNNSSDDNKARYGVQAYTLLKQGSELGVDSLHTLHEMIDLYEFIPHITKKDNILASELFFNVKDRINHLSSSHPSYAQTLASNLGMKCSKLKHYERAQELFVMAKDEYLLLIFLPRCFFALYSMNP